MSVIDPVGLGVGAVIVGLLVAVHLTRGVPWRPGPDITRAVRERRAETLPETEFPEPMNRALGGGAVAAVAGDGEDTELEAGSESETSGPGDISADEVEYHEVEFVKEGETVELANNEPILDQGEAEGWDMPYACRQGQCVSCAGRITSGGNAEEYVVHDGQEMLEDAELDEGYTLTCVAYPKAEFAIETDEAP